ncbi:MAG: hypothetical protein SGJ24_06975 [Chloroflexota bacterium]|nr:hypothetical protein [Chloroflexota bacterium]
MGIFKRIFGGGSGGGQRGFGDGDPAHLLSVYVQPRGCDEVVQVRVNLHNDLSENDDGGGYIVRKTVMGTTCFQRAELTMSFDGNRRVRDQQVEGGTIVDAAALAAWKATRGESAS